MGILGRKSEPWYAAGLQFECRQCGRCCGGAPGYVFVTQDEIWAITAHLAVSLEDFMGQHVRKTRRGFSLVEQAGGDCALLDGGKCRVYPVRPTQCRTWPFWPTNLANRRAWNRAGRRCPGIGSGTLHPLDEIETKRSALLL